jgi:hypothetical protein
MGAAFGLRKKQSPLWHQTGGRAMACPPVHQKLPWLSNLLMREFRTSSAILPVVAGRCSTFALFRLVQ